MNKLELVNPLDSMVKSQIAGKVVFMEATFKALDEIRETTGIYFMNPEMTEELNEEYYKLMRDPRNLVKVMSAFIRHVSDDDIRPQQQEWTAERLELKLTPRNLYAFIESVYAALRVGNDSGETVDLEDAAELKEAAANSPQSPEGVTLLPTSGR
jgi:uncharacterized protein HemY